MSDANRLTCQPAMLPSRCGIAAATSDGAPVRVRLRGADRTGQAHASVDDGGGVTVEVLLDPGA